MANVLITRAAPEAEATAMRVRALGRTAIISPVLEIEPLAFALAPAGVQALLLTSAAAARALAGRSELTALPALAVGPATASAAAAAGFADVRAAEGDAAALIAAARDMLTPGAGAVVHIRGEDVAADVAAGLRAGGYEVREAIAYRAVFARGFTEEARAALRADPLEIESVLFHSARGAESFCALAAREVVAGRLAGTVALCLSPRVAAAANALTWRHIHVAPAPREEALLTLLSSTAGERT